MLSGPYMMYPGELLAHGLVLLLASKIINTRITPNDT